MPSIVMQLQIHAEYDKVNDLYLPHRVVQAFELAQFVRATSGDADLTLVLGDLNLEPTDLGHKLILANANLKDSWVERRDLVGRALGRFSPDIILIFLIIQAVPSDSDPHGNTCEVPANSYVSKASLVDWPNGKRIDYILYSSKKGNKNTDVFKLLRLHC